MKENQNHKSYYLVLPLIRAWQAIRPIKRALHLSECRFYPSCSEYYLEAVKGFGFIKGSFLGLKRICKCNPLFDGGIDPIPNKKLGVS